MRTQPAGRGASVDFRFRNGRRVHFEAHEILFDKLLKDVKDYIASGRSRSTGSRSTSTTSVPAWSPMNQQQYLGRSVARLGPGPRAARRAISTSGSPSPRRSRRPAPTCSPRAWRRETPAGSWSGSTTRSSSRSPSRTRRTTSSPMPAPASRFPGPRSSCSAGDRCRSMARTSSASRPRRCRSRPTMTASFRCRSPI